MCIRDSNKVVAGACFSQYGSCPNGERRDFGPGAGRALHPHGTHVAGIAAGVMEGLSGIALSADIISAQVFSVTEQGMGATDADILGALDWVYGLREQHRIAAVNLSLGAGNVAGACDARSPYTRPFRQLLAAGIVVVSASGNEGHPTGGAHPACVSVGLAVGSLNKNGTISDFSNSFTGLDIVAPGAQIYSSVPGGGFEALSGTSMAAPHVAGAVAVLRSLWPQASAEVLIAALTRSGSNFVDPRNGHRSARLDLAAALDWMEMHATPAPKPDPQPTPAPALPPEPKPVPSPKPEPAPEPEPEPEPERQPPPEPTPRPAPTPTPKPAPGPGLPLCEERIDGILIERPPPCQPTPVRRW